MEVGGFVRGGFEAVAEVFAANFRAAWEVGAAVCVYRDGCPVVDVWAGLADRASGRQWKADTPVLVFSTTKGFTAACVNLLVERGQLDVDAPVAEYWPEFAAGGKQDIPVRWVLSHQAGVPAVDATLTLEQVLAWDPVVAAVAAQQPEWPPGTDHGYHARTFGWMTGELVRRITGVTLGEFLASEIAGPLGLDFWVGLPPERAPWVATLYPSESLPVEPGSLPWRVVTGPSGVFADSTVWNRPDLHAAEMPSSNGIGTAHAIARHYAALIGPVDGHRTLQAETIAAATEVQADGEDRVLGVPSRFGLGFMLGLGPGEQSFGHSGHGGSLGFADPDIGIGFGYTMNRMIGSGSAGRRAERLVNALYRCLRPNQRTG